MFNVCDEKMNGSDHDWSAETIIGEPLALAADVQI
jgi:hypothetical protein